jgi:hypothetical protein
MEDIHPLENRSGWYPELISPGSILFYPYPGPSLVTGHTKTRLEGAEVAGVYTKGVDG